jgi:hypothetical protein
MEGRMCGKDRQVAVDLASNFQKIWKMKKKKEKKRERRTKGGGKEGRSKLFEREFQRVFFFVCVCVCVGVVSEGHDLTC